MRFRSLIITDHTKNLLPTKKLESVLSRSFRSQAHPNTRRMNGHQRLNDLIRNSSNQLVIERSSVCFNHRDDILDKPLLLRSAQDSNRVQSVDPEQSSILSHLDHHLNHHDHPSGLVIDFETVDNHQDFQIVIQKIISQRSQLSSYTCDDLFTLASKVFEDDKIRPTTPTQQPKLESDEDGLFESQSTVAIDYRRMHDRLIRVDQLFQSIQRRLSTEQLYFYLQITILSASIQFQAGSHKSSLSNGDDPNPFFSQSSQMITSLIQRLPSLENIPIPTAHQLSQAIPSDILGLYSRFLVQSYQPFQGGLKLIRKIYYAYLIGQRDRLNEPSGSVISTNDHQQRRSTVLSVIELGSSIISLLRHKTHHRLSALKLAVKMITIGGVYPDQVHTSRLLRRMYMSKSEWDVVIQLQAQLDDPLAARWLNNQIATVEAQDGRVERVLKLSAEALELPLPLLGDFLAPATLSLEVFTHAIRALIYDPQTQGTDHFSGLFGAIAIRSKLLESGVMPSSESDDLILRQIYQVAQGIKSNTSRHEFLEEAIGGMFPTEKIVPIRSEALRCFKFASHPGKSPEAFRLMKWLIKWDEMDLSLQVFQSVSRYGYVTSLSAIPFHCLKSLLRKALDCHPELAMELYQHLNMSGCDRSGELLGLVELKAIHMGDYQLASHLLKVSNDEDPVGQTARIINFISGFAKRTASPGNVLKTLLLFENVWKRWSPLLPINTWVLISDQIKRLGPVKLLKRPELKEHINQIIGWLKKSDLEISEVARISGELAECLQVAQLIGSKELAELHDAKKLDQNGGRSSMIVDSTPVKIQDIHATDTTASVQKLEDLVLKYLADNLIDKAVDVVKGAIEMDAIVSGETVGKVLNRLVDELRTFVDLSSNRLDDKRFVELRDCKAAAIVALNQDWRAMAWKFRRQLRGDDSSVVAAMDRLSCLTQPF